MPATRFERARVKLRASMPWRRLLPDRTVLRTVQGVDLHMPWSHVLPDYARARPTYGQNLVELAAALADESTEDFALVDIGANIGDSALQILNRANGRALCVEGDAYWARYLRMNAGENPKVTIEQVMLAPDRMDAARVRVDRQFGGSSAFVSDGASAEDVPWVSADVLRERNTDFADVRLIKSDTDGYDPVLVPAVARAWSQSGPVLFFEFDPLPAREVAGCDPTRLWSELAELGYSRLAVWDNTGDPLGQLDIAQAPDVAAAAVDPPRAELGYTFWDVAACRTDDAGAAAAFEELVGSGFDPRGKASGAAADASVTP
jgi:FkbM family methyltransferase